MPWSGKNLTPTLKDSVDGAGANYPNRYRLLTRNFMDTLLAQMEAPRLQLVQGRGNFESWEDYPGSRLHNMFKEFRKVVAQELVKRFKLRGTPNEHMLLCLKLNPFIDTSRNGKY